jgi:putative ABC transport system permease protein
MLKNYFTIAWRTLLKNRKASFINIGGLAVGLAMGILIMLLVADEFSYDKFHANLPDIFIMMKHQIQAGETSTGRSTPGPLAAALRTDIPEIKHAARTSYPEQQLLKIGDKSLYENGLYADPEFFDIMSFEAISGNPVTTLQEPGSVVITERTAKKLFGTENPIGKVVIHENTRALKVGAVIRDIPDNSSIQFDIVLPFTLYEKENSNWIQKWDNNRLLNWIELKEKANLAQVNTRINKLTQQRANDTTQVIFAYPLADLRLYGNFKNGKPNGGNIYIVLLLGIIGISVLSIACINFMNLATAQAERRAREVGVRKTLGASRKLIIFQFLSETFLMTFFALLLGMILAKLALPSFNLFAGKNIVIDYSNWRIWSGLVAMGLFTGLLAGSYPAFFLSHFQPVKVLKGNISKEKRGSVLRKGLVTFQFVIAIFMIIGTIVIYKQIQFIHNRPLGYDQENLVEIAARGDMTGKFKILKNDLLRIPFIKSVTGGSDNMVQFGGSINGMDWPGKTPNQDFAVTLTSVQYDWAKTVGLKLMEGRDFNPLFGADSSACLLNQMAVEKMGLKEPVIGQVVGGRTVIGVIQNFVFNNPSGVIAPMTIYLSTGDINHVFVRFQNNDHWRESLAQIERAYKQSNPGYPFEFHFTKEIYQLRFAEFAKVGQVTTLFASMAIFISCLGLFGLSAFLVERRTKEVGIRKVLGASIRSIWFSLSKDFLKPVLLAFLVAAPLAGLAMQQLLSVMVYHIELSWWIFVLAGMLTLLIAISTVSFEALKAALANPVESFRTE